MSKPYLKNVDDFSKGSNFVKNYHTCKKNVTRQKIDFSQNPSVQTFILTRRTFSHKDFYVFGIFGEIHFFWHKIFMNFDHFSAKLYIAPYYKISKVLYLHFRYLKSNVHYEDTSKSLNLTIIMNIRNMVIWQWNVPGSLKSVLTILSF